MWHEPDSPHVEYSATLELDLSTVQPSLAGPKRPQDRVLLGDMKANFHDNVGGMTRGRDAQVGCAVHELDAEGGAQPQAGRLAAKPISILRPQDKDTELPEGSEPIAPITPATPPPTPA